MRRAFDFDVLACPPCGGRLRLIALLDESVVTERIAASITSMGVARLQMGSADAEELLDTPTFASLRTTCLSLCGGPRPRCDLLEFVGQSLAGDLRVVGDLRAEPITV